MATKQDWVDWKQHPVTQEFINVLKFRRENYKETIASAGLETAELIHEYIGGCQALKEAMDYAFRDFEYSDEENQQ